MIKKASFLLFFIVISGCSKKDQITKLPDEYIGSAIVNEKYTKQVNILGPSIIVTSFKMKVLNNDKILPWEWKLKEKYNPNNKLIIKDYSNIIISGIPKEKGFICIELAWSGRHYPYALKFQKRYILEVK